MKKEIKFSEAIEEIRIDLRITNLRIYSGDVEEPMIKYDGEVEIYGSGKKLIIEEGTSKVEVQESKAAFTKIKNLFINQFGGGVINSNNNVIIMNGVTYGVEDNPSIDLILPNRLNNKMILPTKLKMIISATSGDLEIENVAVDDLLVFKTDGAIKLNNVISYKTDLHNVSNCVFLNKLKSSEVSVETTGGNICLQDSEVDNFDARTTSGNIEVGNMILNELMASSCSGRITLSDVDAIVTNLGTVSGDVYASIKEALKNYDVTTNTTSGNVLVDEVECENTEEINDKHRLSLHTVNGDIKVLFKGKK